MNNETVMEHLSRVRLGAGIPQRMLDSRRIIAIAPHPDDMEFSAGGFLHLAAKNGAAIRLLVVSDGSKGSLDAIAGESLKETRMKEQLEAAAILGVNEVEFMEYVDSEVPDPRKLRGPLMGKIRGFRPDLVLSIDPFLPYEAHLDHVNVGKAVLEAVLLHSHPTVGIGTPVSPRPCVALSATAKPNVIINVDDAYSKKMKSIRTHASQMDSSGYVVKEVEDLSRLYGKAIGCKYGEPFRFMEAESLHMNPFADL